MYHFHGYIRQEKKRQEMVVHNDGNCGDMN